MTTISKTITHAVTLGSGKYGSQLTITSTGAIEPTSQNQNGITAPSSIGSAYILNQGTVVGDVASYAGSPGAGIYFAASGSIINQGTIYGGQGRYSDTNEGGGVGVHIGVGADLSNTGTIKGGAGYSYANGGIGVYLAAGTLTNGGTITGGLGGLGQGNNYSGAGGVGVDLASGIFVNSGLIQGGAGGDAGGSYPAGAGAAGLIIGTGATATDSGVIAGGAGGVSTDGGHGNGVGGDGAIIAGGTLVVTGTVEGGAGGNMKRGSAGKAIDFGSAAAGTLEIAPHAVIDGDIVASPAVDDVLVLMAATSKPTGGVLLDYGKTITGFTTIDEASHATWLLGGTLSGVGTIAMAGSDHLRIDGSTGTASILFSAHDTLRFATSGSVVGTFSGFASTDTITLSTVDATSLTYSDGTLTLFNAGNSAVDTLNFAGDYTQVDFGLQPDSKAGTDIVYTGGGDLATGSILTSMPKAFSDLAWTHLAHLPL